MANCGHVMTPETYDWASISQTLDAHGNAMLPGLLTTKQCDDLVALYPQEEGYRTRIIMARHGFGLRREPRHHHAPRAAAAPSEAGTDAAPSS